MLQTSSLKIWQYFLSRDDKQTGEYWSHVSGTRLQLAETTQQTNTVVVNTYVVGIEVVKKSKWYHIPNPYTPNDASPSRLEESVHIWERTRSRCRHCRFCFRVVAERLSEGCKRPSCADSDRSDRVEMLVVVVRRRQRELLCVMHWVFACLRDDLSYWCMSK